jgi:hypothetical protein
MGIRDESFLPNIRLFTFRDRVTDWQFLALIAI